MPSEAYLTLENYFQRISTLSGIESVLHWDAAAVMPEGGSQTRGEQIAELRATIHNLMTTPKIEELIDAAETDKSLTKWQCANVKEMRRKWINATALDANLVIALSKAEVACETAWREARSMGNFKIVLPKLECLVPLIRESATARANKLNVGTYDALLNTFESGYSSNKIAALFSNLETFLPGLLNDVIEHQKSRPFIIPKGPFSEEKQRALGKRFMLALGFDFKHGRLDVSQHPFCGGVPEDIRITTRFNQDDFTSSLMGILHESGHALYERGLPKNWRLQPVGEPLGMAIHESQSLLVEMQVCRSRDFVEFAAPIIREFLGDDGPAWDSENLYRLHTEVKRSFVRVEADEVSYPLHIILRFQLEKAIIEDSIKISDLPLAWNEKFEKLMGISVPNDQYGCLQDIHWYDGAWGYFPTYTLGALIASQLFQSAIIEIPSIHQDIRNGNFSPLIGWLERNIHQSGKLLESEELLKRVTSKPLDPFFFKNHLRSRYLS